MENMSKRKIIRLCILGGLAIFLLFKIVSGFKQNAKAFDEDLPPEHSLTTDVLNLISKKYRDKIKVNEVLRSKVRSPISLITLDDRYSLIIYKIDLLENQPINNLLSVTNESTDRSTGVTYGIVDNNLFSFQYKSGGSPPASKIYLTLSGDSLQTAFKSDTTIGYHLLFKNFSIKYSSNDPIDLFVKSDNGSNVPIDILFLNRNKSCYLLLMTSNDVNAPISADLLYKVVNDK